MIAVEHAHQVASRDRRASSFASQLVGVWTLVSYTNEKPGYDNVHPFGLQPEGFLIYTADGFISAQLMRPGRSAFRSSDWHHGTPEEYQESGSGYIAYCGTYEVDEDKATVTHIPSVSLLPNLIDGRQCRSIELHEDRLTLCAKGVPAATSRLEWKRVTTDSKATA